MPGNAINNTTIWTPGGGFDQSWLNTGVSSHANDNAPANWTANTASNPSQGNALGQGNTNAGFPGLATPVSPLAPGQTDPVGDARRKQAADNLASGFTWNAQGGWDAPGGSDNVSSGASTNGSIDDPGLNNAGANQPANGQTQLQVGQKMYGQGGSEFTWNGSNFVQSNPQMSTPGGQNPGNVNQNGTSNTQGQQFQFQNGVTSSYLDANGQQQFAQTNPFQFATQSSAQDLAKRFGGTAYGDQLSGPGNGWSSPQQLINIPGMQGAINAGLAGDTLNKYGSGPTSYGNFLLNRDIAQNSGQGFNDNYGAWASSQPGFQLDPRLSNSGPGYNIVNGVNLVTGQPAGASDVQGFIQNNQQQQQQAQQAQQQQTQQQPQQQQLQPQQPSPQFTPRQPAPTSASNNIYSQLAPILSLLQQLGIFGGQQGGQQQQQNGGLGSILSALLGGGQQGHQRPPAFPQGTYQGANGAPYYSRWA